jgi:hypothetical protein
MTEDLVALVLEHRSREPFKTPSQVFQVLGADTASAFYPFFSIGLVPHYTIRALGSINGSRTRRGILAVLEMDPENKNKYSILKWQDNIEIQAKPEGVSL